MTLEQILALLTTTFAGVRKDGLKQLARTISLQATTEDETKALVEKLTDAQVNEFIKDYRSEVDKEVSESKKTLESNLKKKYDFVEKKNPDPNDGASDPKDGDPNDIAAIVKATLAAELAPLKQELAGFKTSEISKSRLQTLTEKLNDCKDEVFKTRTLKDFQRMNLSDEEYTEYLTELGTDITTANQNVADSALASHSKPLFTQKVDSGISKGVAEYVESQKSDASVLAGKEV